MSTRKLKFDKLLWTALRCGVLALLGTFIILMPAAVWIGKGKLDIEQCGVITRLLLFVLCLLTQMLLNKEKGRAASITAFLSAVIVTALLLLVSAGMTGLKVRFDRFLPGGAAALVGSLTGTIRNINYSYKKKQNRNARIYRK